MSQAQRMNFFNGHYLPMSPTRQGLTQGQKPEGQLK